MLLMDDLKTLILNTYTYASNVFAVHLGKIAPDYEADIVLIPYNPPTPMTKDNAFGHMLFGAFHQYKPSDVFIKGTQVLKGYTIKESLQTQYNEAHTYALKCWKSIEKETQG